MGAVGRHVSEAARPANSCFVADGDFELAFEDKPELLFVGMMVAVGGKPWLNFENVYGNAAAALLRR